MAIELHIAESAEAVIASESQGLVDFLSDAQCANCDVVVGFEMRKFFPCVVCIEDGEDIWVVCLECAAAVIHPGE